MIRHSSDVPLREPPPHDPCAATDDGFATLAARLARWAHSLPAPEGNGHGPGAHEQRAVVVGVTSCLPSPAAAATTGQLAAAAAAVFPQGVLVVESGADSTLLSQRPGALPSSDRSELARDISWLADEGQSDHVPPDHAQHAQVHHAQVHHTGHSNVWLLRAAGSLLPFEADAFWARLQPLRGSYGLVLVDLPPAGQSEQGCALAALLDGVLLVIEAERTQARVAQLVKERLEALGARLLGVVLTGAREHLPPWLDRRLP